MTETLTAAETGGSLPPSARPVWQPSFPTLWGRAGAAAAEVIAYLTITAAVYVTEFYLSAATGDFPVNNWWIGLAIMALLNLVPWHRSQSLVGSFSDQYIATTQGHAAGFFRTAVRQLIRFGLLYALPFIVFSSFTVLWAALCIATGVMIHYLDRAPWDFVAGTVVTHDLIDGQALLTTEVKTVADLQLTGPRVAENRRARRLLLLAGLSSILISGLIVWDIFKESWEFVSAQEFSWSLLTDIGWFPRREKFDLSTLIVGTLWVTGIAIAVAGPVGLGVAIYLSEYAKPRVREIVKPVIETLASIPSVVLGFFAISFISPSLLQSGGSWFGIEFGIFSLVSAGIAVGILTVPIVASIAEDAMRAVPQELREASYGLGARPVTTATRVVLPAALSGISAAFIVGISRAIGETMVVFIAAGGSGGAIFEANPSKPGQTITAAMASLGAGTDSVAGSGIAFQSLYFLGALLFMITLLLNFLSDIVVRKFRQEY